MMMSTKKKKTPNVGILTFLFEKMVLLELSVQPLYLSYIARIVNFDRKCLNVWRCQVKFKSIELLFP